MIYPYMVGFEYRFEHAPYNSVQRRIGNEVTAPRRIMSTPELVSSWELSVSGETDAQFDAKLSRYQQPGGIIFGGRNAAG